LPNEQQRLQGHLHLLAIFWLVVGFLGLLPVGVLVVMGTLAGMVQNIPWPHAALIHALGPIVLFAIASFLLMISVLCLFAGFGLLKLRPWARTLAIVLGVILLFHPPFGTALGVYTLWVLLGDRAGELYDRMAVGT
jgi:hypothetical protein